MKLTRGLAASKMAARTKVKDIATINQLLTGAEREADRTGDATPGAEHLLLSALALPDGTARRAFQLAGIDPDGLRDAIAAAHATALSIVGIVPAAEAGTGEARGQHPPDAAPRKGPLRINAPAQQAFQRAVARSKATEPAALRGVDVVAAVAEQEHGTAARALTVLGVDRPALLEACQAVPGQTGKTSGPP